MMEEAKKQEKKPIENINLVSFAFDLGFTIAIPLVVFAFLGRLADRYWQISPWGLILGLLFSIIITTVLINRKVRQQLDKFNKL
ncbi:MAG: AtpZ/AtpI family protein [Patescibacteria group bacterium]